MDYLRLAQAYMLISIETGISVSLGLFQAIAFLLIEHGDIAVSAMLRREGPARNLWSP